MKQAIQTALRSRAARYTLALVGFLAPLSWGLIELAAMVQSLQG